MVTDDPTNSAAAEPKRHLLWPLLIVALLAGHVLAVLVMVYVATRDRSFAVEPDYYQKALHWDDVAAQQRENARLGWKPAIEVAGATDSLGQRAVSCRLSDRAGKPLEGAIIDVIAFAHVRASQWLSGVMEPQGGGVYETTLRLQRKGLWEFRLVVRRGSDTLTYTEQRQVQ
jgi:nitrogen fixation protein FixH